MKIHNQNRIKLISRIKKELIGTGSDIFVCSDNEDYTDEVIEGKPLQRYFSAILFPKQKSIDGSDLVGDSNDDTEELEVSETEILLIENVTAAEKTEKDKVDSYIHSLEPAEDDREVRYTTNTFFPSQYGLSFCVAKNCIELEIHLTFGNYKKAKYNDIALHYGGDNIELLSTFGLDEYATYDIENRLLRIAKDTNKAENKTRYDRQMALSKDHRDTGLYKTLTKLFFKDKYKRYHNHCICKVPIKQIEESENQHLILILSEIEGVNTENWHKDHNGNLLLHLKLYSSNADKYFIKVVLENQHQHYKKEKQKDGTFKIVSGFSNSNEALNQLCLFQTEIKITSSHLVPFKDYRANLYKSDEDRMLDYLYRNKWAYGIGHNTACTWENSGKDKEIPTWITTTFLPEYDVKNQSTENNKINKDTLLIRNLSSFTTEDKSQIIANLRQVADAYLQWITTEIKEADNNELGLQNIEKCKKTHQRIVKGIDLLQQNEKAFCAFQLANTAIYLQMFQTALNFTQKDGYEVGEERLNEIQYEYNLYASADYPNLNKIPAWRPFQLAFILQCISSFVEENCPEKDLVDLLYFPTGGGKTEAYLAISAFLIFWRRLQYPNEYSGVNIIIRYTLRLLSAQQFERATKLILACEFIRQHNKDLGQNKITIGFWVGNSTIPNKRVGANSEYVKTLKRLNEGKLSINPFQVSNCQWCNTKMISHNSIGHRMASDKSPLQTYCLNEKCMYCKSKGGLPIVLVDEDIYDHPPTMLFGTVDKFAQLAWNGEATSLFNHGGNRKPELIIQDELHLLNGPLGSLVGLFENVILALCTTSKQSPKIIASTATVKNVDNQILGLYGKNTQVFPQYATHADDTFFSRTQPESKRRYIGILPTGKTSTVTNLRLNAALLYARLEIWQESENKEDADNFWTILSYFKSLKDIGRFSNKITSELQPEIQQLQVRNLNNGGSLTQNYRKLSYRNLELTSRIPNERIKKNLDKLDIPFNGNLDTYKAYDIVLATNMISVGLDVGRLGIMLMNGMPSNTAEYIQASSRVARQNEGVVFTLYDPNNTRDLSYFEDFVLFHKTFYKQVEPLSVTPFAENALDKMLFTLMVSYFRHKLGRAANGMATALIEGNLKNTLLNELRTIFENHKFATADDKEVLIEKIRERIEAWESKIQNSPPEGLFYYGGSMETQKKKNLLIKIQEQASYQEFRVAMQSMRSVEPSAIINLKKY